ncbi:MAG: hypothetical protein ABR549_11835 [Mycobacteriales bacterium]
MIGCIERAVRHLERLAARVAKNSSITFSVRSPTSRPRVPNQWLTSLVSPNNNRARCIV